MPGRFEITRRVAFSETDTARVVHFSNFFRYMEDTEHAFLRSLGLSVHVDGRDGLRGFPRVSVSCSYHKPLRFEEQFIVQLIVRKKSEKSLTYEFVFLREADRETIAEGQMKVVYVERAPDSSEFRAASLPRQIADQIEVIHD